jgi:dTDP-4-amino-4,6-dideoxygalactose transaminase
MGFYTIKKKYGQNVGGTNNTLKEYNIPFNRPSITEREIAEVVDTLRSGWLTTGPKVKRFEELFARYAGARYAVAVNSCTAALHLALAALEIGPGDEVITTPYTFAASAEVILYLGARPVFVDVDPETFNLDVNRAAAAVNGHTRALLPVHIAGLPADLDALQDLARHHGLKVVEDAAHATETRYAGRKIGSIGDATAFSFYATKNLTTGDGGIITTDDDELAESCRLWSYHGLPKDSWKRYSQESASPHVQCVVPGYKVNLTDLQAALGLAQLRRREELLEKRNRLVRHYNELLGKLDYVGLPVHETEHGRWGNHVYVIKLLDESVNRDRFMEELRRRNIGTNLHFYPVHLNLYYRRKYPEVTLPTAEWLKDRILTLPLCTRYSFSDLEYVVEAVREVYETGAAGI